MKLILFLFYFRKGLCSFAMSLIFVVCTNRFLCNTQPFFSANLQILDFFLNFLGLVKDKCLNQFYCFLLAIRCWVIFACSQIGNLNQFDWRYYLKKICFKVQGKLNDFESFSLVLGSYYEEYHMLEYSIFVD